MKAATKKLFIKIPMNIGAFLLLSHSLFLSFSLFTFGKRDSQNEQKPLWIHNAEIKYAMNLQNFTIKTFLIKDAHQTREVLECSTISYSIGKQRQQQQQQK